MHLGKELFMSWPQWGKELFIIPFFSSTDHKHTVGQCIYLLKLLSFIKSRENGHNCMDPMMSWGMLKFLHGQQPSKFKTTIKTHDRWVDPNCVIFCNTHHWVHFGFSLLPVLLLPNLMASSFLVCSLCYLSLQCTTLSVFP